MKTNFSNTNIFVLEQAVGPGVLQTFSTYKHVWLVLYNTVLHLILCVLFC